MSDAADATETHGGLTVERYAEIGAYLRYFPRTDKAAVLEHFGLEKAAWDTARAAWAARVKVSAGGDGVLVDRWNALFDATFQRLEETAPTLSSLAEPRRAAEPPAVAVPSYMRTAPSAHVASAAPAALAAHGARAVLVDSPTGVPSSAGTMGPGSSPGPAYAAPASAPPLASVAPMMLTLQQVAQLAAELEVFPERQGETWSKFDISSEARHAALIDAWRANFRREPRLYDEWRALKASYVEWLGRR